VSSESAAPNAESSSARDAIFVAGLRLLATEGHEALTVRRIATEAGFSTIGVYTWFGGKDGLIDAIFQSGFESFADALESARPLKGPLGRAKAQAKVYRSWALAHPMHYQVMFLKAIPGFMPSDKSLIAGARSFDALLTAVQEAADKGELKSKDLHGVAMTLWSAVHGLVSLELVGIRPSNAELGSDLPDRSYRIMIDALAVGLAVHRE
jgi:AcrR family transcriptional regulator